MPDFDDMMNEVEEELEVQQAEQEIVDRLPQLKQLSADIDKATTAVINAKLSLESSIRQAQREEGELGAAVNTISEKVGTINPNRSLEKVSCHFLMTAIRKIALYMLDL